MISISEASSIEDFIFSLKNREHLPWAAEVCEWNKIHILNFEFLTIHIRKLCHEEDNLMTYA